MTIRKVSSFDNRPVDFLTGKRMPCARENKVTCACCGKLLSKGAVMSNGDKIGDDCEWTVSQCRVRGVEVHEASMLAAGWKTPSSVAAYVRAI